jgi:hypothetical protein
MTFPELSGSPSALFGDRFPYPLDGKQIIFDIARRFAAEFNQAALDYLSRQGGDPRAKQFSKLEVTSAYPTSRQHCPRIAITRQSSTPKLVGLGGEIETVPIRGENGEVFYRSFRGQLVTDNIELLVCTMNERIRDDIFTWIQQYFLDAIGWLLPQLSSQFGTYNIACSGGVDSQVEYPGTAAQPGFEFYVGKLDFTVEYDLVVVRDVDILREIVNWQNVVG